MDVAAVVGVSLRPCCVSSANSLPLFTCFGAAAPAPTQKGAGAASPHTLPLPSGKGASLAVLLPCRWQAAREGDPSAPAALALPSELGRTLRALPPSGCRPRPMSFVLLRGAARGTSPRLARGGTK